MKITRTLIVALGLVTMLLVGCDSTITPDADRPLDEGDAVPRVAGFSELAEARKQLDASLIPNSIDDIFVKLADRFEGFGGAYEDEEGHLVLVSRQPENARAAQSEIVSALLEMTGASDRIREVLLSKEIRIQQATYNFKELAVYRNLIERKLRGDIPLVLTDVDERQNVVLVGLDETANISEANVLSTAAELGIPPEAIAFEHMAVPQAAVSRLPYPEHPTPTRVLHLTDFVRPLAGGLLIAANGGCTLGIPVFYGNPGNQTRGFLTASHCTIFVGINNGTQWGQPQSSSAIGVEFEDPPLTDCDPSSLLCLTDAALIDLNGAHDNSSSTLVGHVYLTNFSSSTGPGGTAITGAPISINTTQAPLMGRDVNKVGSRTGWTTGEITGTCVNASTVVRHPDGVQQLTRLSCYIRADTPVNGGDSGSALFSPFVDGPGPPTDGAFLGILSACLGCNPAITAQTGDGFYVSWAAINTAMNQNITISGGI